MGGERGRWSGWGVEANGGGGGERGSVASLVSCRVRAGGRHLGPARAAAACASVGGAGGGQAGPHSPALLELGRIGDFCGSAGCGNCWCHATMVKASSADICECDALARVEYPYTTLPANLLFQLFQNSSNVYRKKKPARSSYTLKHARRRRK
jgi:hypothetical protein